LALSTNANERAALELAADRKCLHQRLTEAKAVMTNQYRRLFGKGRFDFANRRLIGENNLVLQWLPRMRPDLPESYTNQQTNRGVVVVCLKNLKDSI
jgi:hypothetical protein